MVWLRIGIQDAVSIHQNQLNFVVRKNLDKTLRFHKAENKPDDRAFNTAHAGFDTRVGAFIDIIEERRRKSRLSCGSQRPESFIQPYAAFGNRVRAGQTSAGIQK